MPEIDNHNCVGLCSEKYCDNPETHFIDIDIHGILLILSLCEKHFEEYCERVRDATCDKLGIEPEVEND